jgi:hypothetical protein
MSFSSAAFFGEAPMPAVQLHDVITCPACQTEIDLSEAVENRIRAKMDAELAVHRQQLSETMTQLALREASVKQLEADVASRVDAAIAAEKQTLSAAAKEKAKQEYDLQLRDQASELDEIRGQLRKSQENELSLRQSERKLKERTESLELEVARRVDAEREEVRQKARAEADESHRLKEAEKDAQIDGLRRKIDELKQKAEQGSVQIQGEVLELDIEQMLRSSFPGDQISEVAKGVNGGDVQSRPSCCLSSQGEKRAPRERPSAV